MSMAAVALAITGGGALSSLETTVLLTVDETIDALRKAEQDQVPRARHVGDSDTVDPELQTRGANRPRFFRPLGDGFWPDMVYALAFLVGCALGGLLLGFEGIAGAVIGVSILVVARAVRRRVKPHDDQRSAGISADA